MNTIDRSKRVWLVGVALIAAAGILAGGCDDEKETPTDEGGPTSPIQIDNIIAAPKAGSPGDTLVISAIVTSSTPNEGDIPTMAWTASGGAFLEDDQASVRWIAPDNGLYEISVRATNDVNSVTSTASVFVGELTTIVDERAGAVHLAPNGTDFFFFRTPNNPANGAEVFSVIGGVIADAVTTPGSANGTNNRDISYAPDATFEAHSVDSVNAAAENLAKHLYMGDFSTQSYTKIAYAPPQGEKYAVFEDPDVSPDSRYIAFAGMLPSTAPTIADTFDVFVYDTQDQSRRNITGVHSNHRNFFPTWSTNQSWLTYVSDRSGRNAWDLYGSPVSNGIVDDAQASVVRLSNTGGTLAAGNPGALEKPVLEWNPVAPTLAIMALDGLYLIFTTPSGATQVETSVVPTDFSWSPNGDLLAMTVETKVGNDDPMNNVAMMGLDGTLVDRRVSRAITDTFDDVAWTADGSWLVYRVTRGSSSWLEAFDVAGTILDAPVAITGAEPVNVGARSLGEYRLHMSMSPAVGSNLLYYPTFTGFPTIGVKRLDLTGLSP